eukprot:3496207-Rhodomonas_salina.1
MGLESYDPARATVRLEYARTWTQFNVPSETLFGTCTWGYPGYFNTPQVLINGIRGYWLKLDLAPKTLANTL